MAPADFTVKTIMDLTDVSASMHIDWLDSDETTVDSSNLDSLQLNLDGVGRFHHVSMRGTRIDLLRLGSNPVIQFETAQAYDYIILKGGSRTLHTNRDTFLADLDTRIALGDTVRRLEANGKYALEANRLLANRIVVVFN
jgi:ribonucleotide monophosphatase NagD (HAD superfamily)